MAMTFTAILDDPVLYTEGTFGMSYLASGALLAGQAVCCSGATEAVKVNAQNAQNIVGSGYVGVAGQSMSHGNNVTVYGPGNKVRVRASGAITIGSAVVAVSKGFFKTAETTASGTQGVALESIANNAYGRVLLR